MAFYSVEIEEGCAATSRQLRQLRQKALLGCSILPNLVLSVGKLGRGDYFLSWEGRDGPQPQRQGFFPNEQFQRARQAEAEGLRHLHQQVLADATQSQ
jgi:hypothetical protein